ncbi:MAG: carbon starvation protein A [Candidatus Omnitrophica bacterium]|nr:carbon starvation protein A [Candidatus Omnitrophota bacterium]
MPPGTGTDAVVLIIFALCVFTLAYRYYGLFIAKKVLQLDSQRKVPSQEFADGVDYVKTDRSVVFGHHFAAIAAAGPLLGPVLAAQFGFLPGTLWIVIGAVLAGGVHDMVVLFASVRHKAESLAKIAQEEVGDWAGVVASIAFLFILVLTLAGLSIAVVNALFASAWGAMVVGSTIIIAFIMGFIMKSKFRGNIFWASLIGVILLAAAIYAGSLIQKDSWVYHLFNLSKQQLSISILIYAFLASVLPVWVLLAPRDYLSTYLKIITIIGLAMAICLLRPVLLMPAITPYVSGQGPVIQGSLFPFLFITIACGAISGYHSTIASGTTPKMIASERDIPFVGYVAMLLEGFVAIIALISACVLVPSDYFAINSAPDIFAKLGLHPQNLPWIAQEVHEHLEGRTGGAVSLAVGMAYIFSSMPLMKKLMAYWYHFAIMFEAVFILSAVDAGTRVGRFLLQEMVGNFIPKFKKVNWLPGGLLCSVIFTLSWGYLLCTGSIATIWPLFGMSNQLLAGSALLIVTTMLIRLGKIKYVWVTALPGLFMTFITLDAGYLNIMNNYLPKGLYLLAGLSSTIMALMVILFVITLRKWYQLFFVTQAGGRFL